MRARMHKTQQEQTGYREPVSLALFFFVFLASTFFFDERAALFFNPSLVSPLESLMLGSSAIGFIFRPYLCYRFPTRRHDVSTLMGTLAVAAILATLMARRAWVFLAGGIVLFMALGYIGNAAHSFLALRYAKTPHLARTVAISYASGIVLQFIFHMLVPGDIPNQIVLVAAALAMVTLLHAIAQTKAPDDAAWRDLFTMGTATPPRPGRLPCVSPWQPSASREFLQPSTPRSPYRMLPTPSTLARGRVSSSRRAPLPPAYFSISSMHVVSA